MEKHPWGRMAGGLPSFSLLLILLPFSDFGITRAVLLVHYSSLMLLYLGAVSLHQGE